MEGIRIVLNSYFTSTALSVLHFPGMICRKDAVVLSDTFTGNGVSYRMHSVITDDAMDVNIHNIPYNKEQRCKLFQERNIHHMTLPFKVNRHNISEINVKNENYRKEL